MLVKLMNKLKQGDKNALQEIYNETKNLVFSICYSITNNYCIAEDLSHDTYIKILNNISSYKGKNAKAWICQIAKNISLNYIKKYKRETLLDNEMNLSSDRELKLHDETGIIRLSKKVLSEDNFKIVVLHTIGGLKLKEIAELFEMPQGTVRWKYKDSLDKIRRAYEKQEY